MEPTHPPPHEEARFAPIEGPIKSETTPTGFPPLRNLDSATPPASKSPSQPIPSTEISETADMGIAGPKGKKKGTATVAKKVPKRARPSGAKKAPKKAKPSAERTDATPSDPMEEDGTEGESDNGPYCICRGPDDHRWMIFCERCEDWFHGECINLDKGIGESLIEKFICPNCTSGKLTTLYKKTCAMGACRKPARLSSGEQSVFCSDEHAQMWWERMVSRLPKGKGKTGLNDQLTQGEFMALLSSGMANVDKDGLLKLAKIPFQGDLPKMPNGDGKGNEEDISQILTEEEKSLLDSAANARYHLAQETILCNHMITLVELAQKRRRAAIDAGRFGDDVCGYDSRLDTVSARDAFAAFVKSPEGEAILKSEQLGPPPREDGVDGDDGDDNDDVTRGMCERKRCKAHAGWQKMLVLGIKHQMREMAGQAAEVSEEERVVMEAAGERWRRKRAEKNWVEVVNG